MIPLPEIGPVIPKVERNTLYRAYYTVIWIKGGLLVEQSYPDVRLCFDIMPILRKTPQGVWITSQQTFKEKWVSNTGRIRYAYPTPFLAMNSLSIRLDKRRLHLKNDTLSNATAIAHLDQILEKL